MMTVRNPMSGGTPKQLATIYVTGLSPTDTVVVTSPSGKIVSATWVTDRWQIKADEFGTYTITASNGTKTKTETVLVDEVGEYTVPWEWVLWLYKDGDECEDVTGGWDKSQYRSNNLIKESTYIKTPNTNAWSGIATVNQIHDLVDKKLFIDFENVNVGSDLHSVWTFTSGTAESSAFANDFVMNNNSEYPKVRNTIGEFNLVVDLNDYNANLISDGYLNISVYGTGQIRIKRIWLE